MLRIIKGAAASAVVFGLIACSSSSSPATSDHDGGTGTGSDAGGGSEPTTLAGFCQAAFSAEATLASTCLGGSVAQYEADEEETASAACASLQTGVTAGRVAYDMDQAPACLSAYKAITCADLQQLVVEPAACKAALSGKVAKGGACYSDLDCAGNAYCSLTSTCAGTCADYVAAGAACDATKDQCATGYGCTTSGTSTTGKCTADPTPTYVGVGKSCKFDQTKPIQCNAGLACDELTNLCVTTVADGDACTPGAYECVPFDYCDGKTKKCVAYPTTGGACGVIAGGAEYAECGGKSYCKTAAGAESGTCSALEATGAACTAGNSCASNTCTTSADGTSGKCAAPCAIAD